MATASAAPILLDSGPLGRLAQHSPRKEDMQRLSDMLTARRPLLVPEIADFEVRRNLLLHKNTRSLARLDILKADLIYVPITTAQMLKSS